MLVASVHLPVSLCRSLTQSRVARCIFRSTRLGHLCQSFKGRIPDCSTVSGKGPVIQGGSLRPMAIATDATGGASVIPRDAPDPASMRGDYALPGAGLLESQAHTDPMEQFDVWFKDAVNSEQISEANAMCIATATPEGRPSNRMVLMKGYDQRGFIFYSNYSSRKGQELQKNSHASLCFWWEPLHRSVRVEGQVQKLPAAESDAYFHSRPRGSQIGAVVSHQSSVLEHGREELEQREQELQQKYADDGIEIPRPDNWGGYVVSPSIMEFWHGKKSRLHDRVQYSKQGSLWKMERLSP